MKFSYVAQLFEHIEKESARNEITKLLASLLTGASAREAQIISYLSSGSLFPAYKTLQFNISAKGILPIVSQLLDQDNKTVEDEFKKSGDLGLLVQGQWFYNDSGLSIVDIYDALVQCAQFSGIGSTDKKQACLVQLLQQVDMLSAKYIIRIIAGTLRLGFSDMTVIDALSWMQVGDKSIRKEIEHAYNICADLGLVAYTLKQDGIQGVKDMKIHVGIPIRPAAAERLNSPAEVIEKLGESVAQPKLDGFRVQVHLKKTHLKTEVEFFSRNLLDMSDMFPDLKEAVEKLSVDDLICEGEAIVYDEDTETFLPFQETVKRKRKHDIEQLSQDLPLRLYIFDILYLNGRSLLAETHHTRRVILENLLGQKQDVRLQIIDEKKVATTQELETYFLKNIHAGLEGLVVKREDALYQPGKRNFNWIKLKRHARGKLVDTIDCVILGYYHGKGKRAHFGIGAFLVGVYNEQQDNYESVAKIGTGMTDEEWRDLKKQCELIRQDSKPQNVDVVKDLYPDVWVVPTIVCTIQSDEITLSPVHTAGKTQKDAGYALRFPRFIMYRSDKFAQDATTVKELQKLYALQKIDNSKS